MKKIYIFIILILCFLFPKNVSAYSDDEINLYLFYGETCPHCHELRNYLNTIKDDYPKLHIYEYEVWRDLYGKKMMDDASKVINEEITGVPFTVIGEETFTGFSKGYTDKNIKKTIEHYMKNYYNDVFGIYLGISEKKEDKGGEKLKKSLESISVPFVGEVNLKGLSIISVTVILGIVDGFNPCAMWVLLFLISMLIGLKDRKRMWILGFTFIFTSAIIYFLFMSAWLNLMEVIGTPIFVRALIGIFALVMGGFNLKTYFESRKNGIQCKVVGSKKKNKIIDNIKKFTKEKNLLIALLGIIVLAITVNVIELFCSLGLPVIYTEFLHISNLSGIQYYLYILLYTFFFMLDDIVIFVIAMFTLKITGITNKYSVIAKLIGGVIMVLIGILMIFAPELLM